MHYTKNILRRLFAFHRSSMLEVCRGASRGWEGKPLSECLSTSQTLQEVFSNLDGSCGSSPPSNPILREPTKYYLRVISSNGALIREDCEMEGSRVVFLAPMGSICVAYKRSQTLAGVVRYRTEHDCLVSIVVTTKRQHRRCCPVAMKTFPRSCRKKVSNWSLQQFLKCGAYRKICLCAKCCPTL